MTCRRRSGQPRPPPRQARTLASTPAPTQQVPMHAQAHARARMDCEAQDGATCCAARQQTTVSASRGPPRGGPRFDVPHIKNIGLFRSLHPHLLRAEMSSPAGRGAERHPLTSTGVHTDLHIEGAAELSSEKPITAAFNSASPEGSSVFDRSVLQSANKLPSPTSATRQPGVRVTGQIAVGPNSDLAVLATRTERHGFTRVPLLVPDRSLDSNFCPSVGLDICYERIRVATDRSGRSCAKKFRIAMLGRACLDLSGPAPLPSVTLSLAPLAMGVGGDLDRPPLNAQAIWTGLSTGIALRPADRSLQVDHLPPPSERCFMS